MSSKFVDYKRNLPSLSDVKAKILDLLWDDDSIPFPKPWVRSSVLLEHTKQKYFDRRTRELRDEGGCDIETRHIYGEHSYRLVSDKVKVSNPREYLSATEKNSLFLRHRYRCQICGKILAAGVRGLQADHKVPLQRGGAHELTNWQPICNECNVGKRRACAGCKDDCLTCAWAFPDKVGKVTLLRLPNELLNSLAERFGDNQQQIQQGVVNLLKKGLESK